MQWIVKQSDILMEPADVLICSANVFLNLSGGVGGELLLRYGDEMQTELHRHLADHHMRFVQQGEVVPTSACGTPFKAVLHAVAVDGFYKSSSEVVTKVVTRSLEMAAAFGDTKVALTALATGFGRLRMTQFALGVKPLKSLDFSPIEQVVICVRHESEREEIVLALGVQ